MQALSNDTFGPLVAYLVPGVTVLLALRPYSPTIDMWFAGSSPGEPSLGGFLFLTLTALAAGMLELVDNPALAARLGARAEHDGRRFDVSATVRELEVIYRELAGARP